MARTRNVRSTLLLAGSMALMAASPAWPQQPAQTVQQLMLQRLPVGTPLERYLDSMRADFFIVDADRDGEITQRDVELHTVMEGVEARTQAIQMVLRYDLDGDGFVTEDEIRRSMNYSMRAQLGLAANNKLNNQQLPMADAFTKQIDLMVRSIMALDADKDGKVSLAEGANFGAGNRGR